MHNTYIYDIDRNHVSAYDLVFRLCWRRQDGATVSSAKPDANYISLASRRILLQRINNPFSLLATNPSHSWICRHHEEQHDSMMAQLCKSLRNYKN
nr:hypothetical protein CFP56_01250 [Quercus suber]